MTGAAPSHPRPAWRTGLLVLGVAVAYFVAARLGLALAFVEQKVTLVWPPTGVALAALLIFGGRALPGVVLGALATNLSTGSPLLFCAVTAVGNPLEAVVGAWVLRRCAGFDNRLGRMRDVLALVLVGSLLSPLFSATLGVAGLCASGAAPWSAFGSIWRGWCLGDGMGVLLFAPALLTCASARPGERLQPQRWELAGLFTLGVAAVGLVFLTTLPEGLDYLPLPYFLLPLLLWAAIRFGPRGAGCSMLLTAAVALAGTVAGLGPFARESSQQNLAMLLAFLSMIAFVSLTLGAILAERNVAEQCAGQANVELEQRVRERTGQLAEANEQLTGRAQALEAQERAALNLAQDAEEARLRVEQTQDALHHSRDRFELVARGAVDGIWDWNVVTNEVYLSDRWCALLGHAPDELPPRFETWADHLHPEDKDRAFAAVQAHFEKHAPYDLEYRLRLKSGDYGWFRACGQARWNEAGQPLRLAGSITDITERKRQEEQIKASLHEKEVLLKEIHHRVKNNLQVISSILQMQSRAIADPHYRGIFGDCQARVRTMALVHEKLYRSASLAHIDLAEEIQELVAMLATSCGRPGVRFHVTAEPTVVDIETAVPLGLVLNELVANALKHAFSEDRAGTVFVTLTRPTPAQLVLSVRDDGRGLPSGFTAHQASTLGLTMVHALAGQLRATVEVRSEGGVEFLLKFPAPAPILAGKTP